MQIIKIAYTGNHYLSVIDYPLLKDPDPSDSFHDIISASNNDNLE